MINLIPLHQLQRRSSAEIELGQIIDQEPDQQPSPQPLPKNETILKAEQIALAKFLITKGCTLNVRQGGHVTGCFGYLFCAIFVVGPSEGPSNYTSSTKQVEEEMFEAGTSIGYEIAAIPGRFIGLLTAPIRMTQLCMTRHLLYTKSQIEDVCQNLRTLQPELQKYDEGDSLESFEAKEKAAIQSFQEKVQSIIQTYGASVFSTSNSSSKLMDEININIKQTSTVADKIITYLAEEETPMKLLSWKAQEYSKNQGKRLFNVIMENFLEK